MTASIIEDVKTKTFSFIYIIELCPIFNSFISLYLSKVHLWHPIVDTLFCDYSAEVCDRLALYTSLIQIYLKM